MTSLLAMQLQQWINLHYKSTEADHLRLGQRFCNTFIKESWPELYYEANDAVAKSMIEVWLDRHQYYTELPPAIDRIALAH